MASTENKGLGEPLWDILEAAEAKAVESLDEMLSEFRPVIYALFECVTIAPRLTGQRGHTPDLILAALFLKRTLNDLRALWILVIRGYTSQASSIAASLFENATAAAYIAGEEKRAKEWLSTKNGEMPWSFSKLCKMLSVKRSPGIDPDRERALGHDAYPQYKWLCKVKHPTLPSAFHDAGSARGPGNTFIVRAFPDTRPEDIPVKAGVLMCSARRVLESAESFIAALGTHDESEEWRVIQDKMKLANSGLDELILKYTRTRLPFRL